MQTNQLSPKHTPAQKKRVGRGGKKGTYSGKGLKGQKSRAGRKMVPIVRELIKRYPKLKGYRAFSMDKNLAVVNLEVLEKRVQDGDVITPAYLAKHKMVATMKGKVPQVKILGKGTLTKKLSFEGCLFSATAKQAVEKAGGSIK